VKGKIVLLALVALVAAIVAIYVPLAGAASPEQQCTDSGGQWTKDPPTGYCTYPGTAPGDNNGGVVKGGSTTSDIGQSPPHETTSTCKVSNNGGDHGCTTTSG
jgi:hypothetical protein